MKSILFAAAVILLALPPAWVLGQETQQGAGPLAEAVLAVVTVRAYDADAEPVAQGSGFFVSSDGLLVTCYHVISEAVSAEIVLSDGTTIAVTGMCEGLPGKDLALLKVDLNDAAFLSVAEQEAAVGDKAFVIGSPQGLASTLSDGLVSGYRAQEDGPTLLQTSAPISAGSSGGPVLNIAGEVIGVTTSSWRFGSDLNFAVPARYVRGLLLIAEEPGPLPADPASDPGASERAGSDDAITVETIINQLPEGISPFRFNDAGERGNVEGWTLGKLEFFSIWAEEYLVGKRLRLTVPPGSDLDLVDVSRRRASLSFSADTGGDLPGEYRVEVFVDAETITSLATLDVDAGLTIVGRIHEFRFRAPHHVTEHGYVVPIGEDWDAEDLLCLVTLLDGEILHLSTQDESEDNEQEGATESEPEPVDDETAASRIFRAAEQARSYRMSEMERQKLMNIIELYPETEAATKARERIEQMDAELQDAADDAEADE